MHDSEQYVVDGVKVVDRDQTGESDVVVSWLTGRDGCCHCDMLHLSFTARPALLIRFQPVGATTDTTSVRESQCCHCLHPRWTSQRHSISDI